MVAPALGPRSRDTPLVLSLTYVCVLWPFPTACGILCAFLEPKFVASLFGAAALAWATFCFTSNTQYRTGAPDAEFSQNYWVFVRMRNWFQLKLHRTETVQEQLMKQTATGQAIFAFFPHGVNSDFRVLMDGLMYDAFSKTYEKAPARTLAASVLFWIPGVRQFSLRTACVDAGRPTANHCLRKGHSLMLCPGGQDEQVETIFSHERVFLKTRAGFVRLALEHGVSLVPAYNFGSTDVYHTSRAFHGFRRWLVRTFRLAIPLYYGGWGLFMYPTPMGFPLPVPQNVVFGDPLHFGPAVADPTREQVAAAHARFIEALTSLFEEHKAAHGYGDRRLEII